MFRFLGRCRFCLYVNNLLEIIKFSTVLLILLRLEPNGAARNFEVATGDKFKGPITGIVGYSYQNFKIYASLDEMKELMKKEIQHRRQQK